MPGSGSPPTIKNSRLKVVSEETNHGNQRIIYMYKILSLTYISFLLLSCSKDRYFIYSPDRTQGITIINEGDIRYVIDGIHSFSVPESNFVKLMIPNKEIAEEVFICWGDDNIGWDLVIRKSKILINTLDSNLYKLIMILKEMNETCLQ